MRDQIVADLKAKDVGCSDRPDTATTTPDAADMRDPLSLPMVQLQGQLHANRVEIANREHSVADLKTKVVDYQARSESGTGTRAAALGSDARIRAVQSEL